MQVTRSSIFTISGDTIPSDCKSQIEKSEILNPQLDVDFLTD